MKVETYEVELVDQNEIQALANEGEHAMLIEKLGLTGQQKLIGGADIKPFPYRVMTTQEQKVFELLFPIKTPIESFSSELIPIRVLQVAAHAKDTGFLDKGLFIWHPEDSKLDPVLCGYASIPDQSWGQRIYLLARWGAALKPFTALLAEAKQMWSEIRKAKITQAKRDLDAYADTLNADADLYFNGKNVDTAVYLH